MMNALPPTASHRHLLERELVAAPAGATIIEHGCGMYSSLVIARLLQDRKVVTIEADPVWRAWATWMYEAFGCAHEVVARPGDVELERAYLVFVDGQANERVKLVNRALLAGAPRVIMHDTEPEHWDEYDLRKPHFEVRGYRVEHDLDGMRRTTLWSRVDG